VAARIDRWQSHGKEQNRCEYDVFIFHVLVSFSCFGLFFTPRREESFPAVHRCTAGNFWIPYAGSLEIFEDTRLRRGYGAAGHGLPAFAGQLRRAGSGCHGYGANKGGVDGCRIEAIRFG
jgi:hypothetical protein